MFLKFESLSEYLTCLLYYSIFPMIITHVSCSILMVGTNSGRTMGINQVRDKKLDKKQDRNERS